MRRMTTLKLCHEIALSELPITVTKILELRLTKTKGGVSKTNVQSLDISLHHENT